MPWEHGPFRARVSVEFGNGSPARQRELATADACVTALRQAIRGMDEEGRAQLAEVVAEQTLGQQERGGPISVEPAALALSRAGQVHDLVAGVRRALAGQRGA